MLPQAFWISLRILFFRSGPEDFPYDKGRALSTACIAFGVLVNAAVAMVSAQAALEMHALPAMPSLLFMLAVGTAAVLAMGLFTRLALQARQLDNRFQQTFNALLVTSSILSLVMVPPIRVLIPLLGVAEQLRARLEAHPELANDPATLSALPPWSLLVTLLLPWLLIWQFAVTTFIYRRAANVQTGGGILIALLCLLSIASFKALFATLFS
ncbi:MAG TPA: hypothetical protein VFA75_13685 [Nevskia sp.]|nr:hypothetical protein [Nevskia sp.]